MIHYTVSPLFGFPIAWLTEIIQVDPPRYFADEQRLGPYKMWHHEHFFRELSEGQTEIRDLIHYVPPLGPFGRLINTLLIERQLAQIFDFRARTLEKMSLAARHTLT